MLGSEDGIISVYAYAAAAPSAALDSEGDFVNDHGEAIVDGAFRECVLRSAPCFALRIDGITGLNSS